MKQMNSKNWIKWALFLSLGFLSVLEVYAQENIQGKETVTFSIPKTLYFSGEKIWIDASVLLGASPASSQVLYAELVDQNSNSIDYVKMPLVQGKALNYFPIKLSIPSANYLLRVYTRISPYLDQELGIAQQLVTIVNPTIPPASKEGVMKKANPISSSSESFSKAQKMSFQEKVPSESMLSMGISIANPFLPGEQEQISSKDIYQSLQSKELLPELFGHVVEVKVPKTNEKATYFLSVHGKQSALFTDIPDEEGKLLFDIGGLKHWDRMIIQLENGEEMPGLEVVSPVIKTKFKDSFQIPTLVLEEKDLPRLEMLLKAAQVETYYKESYYQDSMAVVTGFVADYTYNLDDYARFEEVEVVLREYVPSVMVRTKDRKKEFRLTDQAVRGVFDTNPLILVDAMPVFDSDMLATFNPKFMKSLEVLNREFYLNEHTYAGVLSWSSYDNNFGLFPLAPSARFFDYLGLQPKIELDRGQYSLPAQEEKFPDWRTILFWNSTDSGLQNLIAPDLDGDFVFWTRTKDGQGKIQVKRSYFSIQP